MSDLEINLRTKKTGNAFGDLSRDVTKAKAEFRDLQAAARIDPSLDTKVVVDDSQLDAAGRKVDQLDNEQVRIRTEVEDPDARAAVASVEDQMADVDLGGMRSSMSGQFGTMFASGGPVAGLFAAAGAGFGADFIEGFGAGFNRNRNRINERIEFGIQEGTDLTAVGQAAGSAFSGGFGEGLADLRNTALTLRAELSQVDRGLDLTASTKQAEVLATRFGIDIPQSINVTRRMISAGLVRDTDEAFDLMVASGQRFKLNQQEILEVVSEFSPVFGKMNISGAQAFGTIGRLVQEGILPNVDRAAELFEEFNIRMSEADTLRPVIQRLGLDFEDMQAKLANGRGDEVLERVTRALLEIEDPAKRNAAALEIFGAAIESASDPEFALQILNQAEALQDYTGAAEEAAAAAEGNQSIWEENKRAAIDLGAAVGGAAEWLYRGREAFAGWADAGGVAAVEAANAGDEVEDMAAKAAAATEHFMALNGDTYELSDGLDNVASSANELAAETERLEGALRSLSDWADGSGEAALRSVHSAADALTEEFTENIAAAYDLRTGWDLLSEAGRTGSEMTDNLRQDIARLTEGLLDGSVTAPQYTAAMSDLETQFREAAAAAGMQAGEVDRLAGELFDLPGKVENEVVTHTSAANQAISDLNFRLDGIDGKTANTYTNHNITTRRVTIYESRNGVSRQFAHGGIVGSDFGTAQSGGVRNGLTLVGEEGPELLDLPPGTQVHSNPDTKRMMGDGLGGGGGGDTIVNVYVAGSVIAERDLDARISDSLRQSTLAS